MPIYEYECGACGHLLEKLQKMSDAPLVNCPACSEDELKKKISAAGFRLKGGGWYETDFKTGSKKNLVGEGKSSTGTASANTASATASSSTATTNKSA
ncbi:MAG: zinc ribbon domain-containing protein [Pseudomonadales bacterium]|nr:zinc ribbon domain-containing protein [Pseudomonadales bacterium]MCP5215323.1 zinc ribbon domain-containing protein [Pseudomonadales bacterium]